MSVTGLNLGCLLIWPRMNEVRHWPLANNHQGLYYELRSTTNLDVIVTERL